jgi:hypothetical protein
MAWGDMTADRFRLRIRRIVRTAYSDLFRVLKTMPLPVAIVAAIMATFAAIDLLVPDRKSPAGAFSHLALSAFEVYLLTPFYIGVHRFIILGEVMRGYVLDPTEKRFTRFLLWSLIFTAMAMGAVVPQHVVQAIGLSAMVSKLVIGVTVGIVALIIGLPLTVLFPAIAVDAPGATALNAFGDTKGHAFQVFCILAISYLPFLAIDMAFMSRGAAASVVLSGLSALAQTLFVAVGSRIFQALADRLVGGAEVIEPPPI